MRLAQLPQLARLHLSGNPLSEVCYPCAAPACSTSAGGSSVTGLTSQVGAASGAAALQHDQQQSQPQQQQQPPPQPFQHLAALFLGNARISSWASVDQLALFPSLAELRLSGNPVTEDAKSGGRFEVCGGLAGGEQE